MTSAGVAFDCGNVIDQFRGVGFAVSFVAAAAVFFVHPCNHAQSAARMEMKPLKQLCSGHRDHDTDAVINGAAPEIPRIQMSGYDDDLFGILASLDVSNDVVTGGVRQVLRRECEVHANAALGSEMLDQVGIFSRECGGGNGSGKTESSVREAVVG